MNLPATQVTTVFNTARAQRQLLNAFRHHWNLHFEESFSKGRSLMCSTPFGIIGIFTVMDEPRVKYKEDVLNAFRHHWNLHFKAPNGFFTKATVLNAFRHHWNLHQDEVLR